jgi:hypothetical protein
VIEAEMHVRLSGRRQSTFFANEIGDSREFTPVNLFVGEPESPDAPHVLKPLVAAPVLLGVVTRTVNLDDDVEGWQVEIRDPIKGRVEALLKTIGKAERSEVGAEQVFFGRCPLLSLSDKNGVLLRARKLGKRDTGYARHTSILTRDGAPCREEKNRVSYSADTPRS